MKRFAIALPFAILLAGCGGGSDSATPVAVNDSPPSGTLPPPVTVPTTTTSTTAKPTTTAPKRAEAAASRGAVRTPATSNCSASRAAAHACWDHLINQYSWNTTTAFNIMWCESTGNPNAKNPRSTATGLFQILGGPYDPAANVRLAYQMYSKRGWQPWVCKG